MDYKFCDTQDVLALTRIGDGYTKLDSLIEDLLPLVANQIQTYCRRNFIKQVYTEYLGTRETCGRPLKLYLNERNVAQSPAPVLKLDYGYPLDWSVVTALATSQYRIDYEKGIITLLFEASESSEAIQCVYTAGYATDATDPTLVLVPVEIKRAAAMQAAYLLGIVINQNTGQTAKNAAAGKAAPLDKNAIHGLIPQVRGLLAPHRKQLIGTF